MKRLFLIDYVKASMKLKFTSPDYHCRNRLLKSDSYKNAISFLH